MRNYDIDEQFSTLARAMVIRHVGSVLSMHRKGEENVIENPEQISPEVDALMTDIRNKAKKARGLVIEVLNITNN